MLKQFSIHSTSSETCDNTSLKSWNKFKIKKYIQYKLQQLVLKLITGCCRFLLPKQPITRSTSFPLMFPQKIHSAEKLLSQRSKSGFYIQFNSQGHIVTGPQHCHLWEWKPHRGDSL